MAGRCKGTDPADVMKPQPGIPAIWVGRPRGLLTSISAQSRHPLDRKLPDGVHPRAESSLRAATDLMSLPHLPLWALLLLVPAEGGVEEGPLPCPPTSETSPPLTFDPPSSLIWLQKAGAPVRPRGSHLPAREWARVG